MKKIWIIFVVASIFGSGCVNEVDPRAFDESNAEANGIDMNRVSHLSGHEQGNGSDKSTLTPAWFLGDRVIKYCHKIAPNFVNDERAISTHTRDAFNEWRKYISEKKINETLLRRFKSRFSSGSGGPGDGQNESKLFVEHQLATRSEQLLNCDGSEDLTFYFGVSTPLIERIRSKLVDPTAFAYLQSYDAEKGWGRGLIWFAPPASDSEVSWLPDWNAASRLYGFILHEIGHVFGVGHVNETIMRPDLGYYLSVPGDTSTSESEIVAVLTHIDFSNELYSCPWSECSYEYNGVIDRRQEQYPEDAIETFWIFMGRKPVGKMRTLFKHGKVYLSDDSTLGIVELNVDWKKPSGQVLGPIFKTYSERNAKKDEAGMHTVQSQLYSMYQSYLGTVRAHDGLEFPVLVERNMGWSRLRITYFIGGEKKSLLYIPTPGRDWL